MPNQLFSRFFRFGLFRRVHVYVVFMFICIDVFIYVFVYLCESVFVYVCACVVDKSNNSKHSYYCLNSHYSFRSLSARNSCAMLLLLTCDRSQILSATPWSSQR